MVLVDSSVWIALEKGRFDVLDMLPDGEEVATCPIVVTEVLRGARTTRQYEMARMMFIEAAMLDAPTPLSRFEQAAQLYRECRDAGVTPSTPDLLVAACAIAYDIPLLHDDTDFNDIARVTQLRIFSPS